jgi:hypothetical protein
MVFAHTLSPEVRAALPSPHALHASPTFVLCGPRRRGQFSARRATRMARSDDYRARLEPGTPDVGACLHALADAWAVAARK